MPVRFSGLDATGVGPVRRVLCYGDSLTVGFCNFGFHFEPYGKTMAEALTTAGTACEVAVCGLSGRTAQEMIEEKDSAAFTDCADVQHVGEGLARLVGKFRPDLVVILAGTNDLVHADFEEIGHEVNAAQILARLQELHGLCHTRGCPTVALVPPCGLFGEQRRVQRELAPLMAEWVKASEQVLGIYDVEKLAPRSLNSRFWDSDDLHMSVAGQRMFGQNLALRILGLLHADPMPSQPLSVSSQPVAAPPQPDLTSLQPDPALSPLVATKPPVPLAPPPTGLAEPGASAQQALAAKGMRAIFEGAALVPCAPAPPRPALSTQLAAAQQALAAPSQARRGVDSSPRKCPAVPVPSAARLASSQLPARPEVFRATSAPVQTATLPAGTAGTAQTSCSLSPGKRAPASPIASPRLISGVLSSVGTVNRTCPGSDSLAPSYSPPSTLFWKSTPRSPRVWARAA